MRLAAIYNVWDGIELLAGSMRSIQSRVDEFIIVWQDISNFGDQSITEQMIIQAIPELDNITFMKHVPVVGLGMKNEIAKRNIGIEMAKHLRCTHFILMDTDEYYDDFGYCVKLFDQCGHRGSVCKLLTYFRHPTLRFENPDNYYVPFIHELNDNSITGNKSYPFYVDPTRRINEIDVVELPIYMHHFSYVRENIDRKLMNSSARNNIIKIIDQIKFDYENASPGFVVKSYNNQKLITVDNKFNICE